ncbi:hypothetical protein GCM10007231_32850 [Nocardioides daphniae]|uniref:PucR family transcriptional regulator n=2 Tax=Nocardioides daphniae TaxID=402297 RepID=A0ABQ1QMN5_9ACTN|nr:hypothetical protein GCM10007231_32850 [Nocardioides daphniae]
MQTAHMTTSTRRAPWPPTSDRMRELFRQGALLLAHPTPALLERVNHDVLASLGPGFRLEDPTLDAAFQRVNETVVRRWVEANAHRPGERVEPYLGAEAFDLARDLVRHGLDAGALDSYRIGQNHSWQWWMAVAFTLTDDVEELREFLALSSHSVSTYLDDTIEAVAMRVAAERDQLVRGTHAERLATVNLLLEGAPLPRAVAEQRLGHALTGPQTAAVIWCDEPLDSAEPLEQAADALVRAVGAARRLSVVISASSVWVWLPGDASGFTEEDLARVAPTTSARISLGRPGHDLAGFRRSHLDAVATQRLLMRLASPSRVAHYQEVQMAALLTHDLAAAEEFVHETLGDLATADEEVRRTVAAFVREQFNTSRTAERLFTHRNTVIRRLARADDLLPRPLASHAVAVAAALDIVRLRGGL